jgi:LmbE family N-acetylglucosaminyl deacetylase
MALASEVLNQMNNLPLASLRQITRGATVMILAPHPDDESLGCGGLIAQACAAGQPPIVTVLTDGTGSHPSSASYPPHRLRDLRENEARLAVSILGLPANRIIFLGVRDTAVPKSGAAFQSVMAAIVLLLRRFRCGILCAPWRYDPHGDHEAAYFIARAAAQQARITLLVYPVWGWTLALSALLPDESISGWRLDIAGNLAAKRRAIAAHASQYGELIRDDPNGFRLPGRLLNGITRRPYEVLLRSE